MLAPTVIFFGLASSALADIYVTSPVTSTSWAAGDLATITWEDNTNDATYNLVEFGEAEVSIAVGSAASQTKVFIIAENVTIATTAAIQFTIDGSIGPDSENYFIRIDSNSLTQVDNSDYPAQAFSAKFALTNMSGSFNSTVQSQIDAGQPPAPLGGTNHKAISATHSANTTRATSTASRTGNAYNALVTDGAPGIMTSGATMWASLILAAIAGLVLF